MARPVGTRPTHEGPGNRSSIAICGADLSYPAPRIEAKACLRIARLHGGPEKMRQAIRITTEEQRTLRHLADIGEIPLPIVIRAIEYRLQVLDAFDRLAANEASNAEK